MPEPYSRIWLQWDPEGETSWCQDKINEDDIEYVRVESVEEELLKTALRCGQAEGLLYRIAAKLDAITEATDGIWGYLEVHGQGYVGPNYGEDLKAIKKFLAQRKGIPNEGTTRK